MSATAVRGTSHRVSGTADVIEQAAYQASREGLRIA
jgi:hypothetical protein